MTHYYGNNIELVTAEKVSGSLMSYPGEELFIGLSNQSVMEIQGQLNTISKYYQAIPKVVEDGI